MESRGVGATAWPFKAALIEPPCRAPHAESIVQQQLHSVAPGVGEQVTMMGLG
jgi:hypothetical protein